MNRLTIVNADDFGKSHEVNLGVVEGFKRGILTRTTLMVNMPFADEAVMLARNNGFETKVGLHLNLTEGESLTSNIRSISWIYINGEMRDSTIRYLRSHWNISSKEKSYILEEIKAQIIKYKAYNLPLNHIDSHQHVHNEYLICKMLCKLAVDYHFTSMRIARNLMPLNNIKQILKWGYKKIINQMIHSQFDSTDFFGSYEDYKCYYKGNCSVEIMLHPYLDKNGLCDIVEGNFISMDSYRL